MSTHKNIDRICVIAVVVSILLSVLFINAEALGITQAEKTMGYENRLFDTSRVHTLDIVIDDWDSFLSTAQNEEYSECTVIIDGEAYKNAAIRGKGNTSLSTVSSMDSNRYSFKIEFDHYDSNKSYHGLDKLSLNNIIQDTTYMKDYLTYRMMNEFGVNAPLCSYAYITVNGEDWGLYLAVEGIEDAFLQRNYANSGGELYKPDSLSFGGGRGNGMDFSMDDFMGNGGEASDAENSSSGHENKTADFEIPEDFDFTQIQNGDFEIPEDFDFTQIQNGGFEPFGNAASASGRDGKSGFGDSDGGMGSSDVKLQYIDDDADSYSNIFDNAKTDITDEDKERLIASLKKLSENTDIASVVDIEKVIRYFVVHNFVCNGDSYTGSMIHNYYLYEENGQLSMIPWDYNLAYGTFQSGNAQSEVNSPIDSPVSGDMSDRPMINWIFESEEYTELYHRYFAEFLGSVDISGIINSAAELIAPYVEKDPTKFYTYEEFETGVSTLLAFCELRTESVKGQLDGSIPSTSDGQSADSSSLVDASSIKLSDMGTMNMGGSDKGGSDKGGFSGGNRRGRTQDSTSENGEANIMQASVQVETAADSEASQTGVMPQEGVQPPDGFGGNMQKMPEGMGGEMPEGFGGEVPEGFGGEMPEGFGGEIPEGTGGEIPETTVSAVPEAAEEQTADTAESSVPENTPSIQSTSDNAPENSVTAKEESGNERNHGSEGMQMPQSKNAGGNTSAYILLGVSVLILGGGLIFACKFKR